MKGIIVIYNTQRGFGFIRCRHFADDVFVHINQIAGKEEPTVGQQVYFTPTETEKGTEATEVRLGGKQTSPTLIFGFLAIVIITAGFYLLQERVAWYWLTTYLVMINATTSLFYAYDKIISITAWLRIPEKILHLLALLGGSPAALLSQQIFRHKTAKKRFLLAYWIIVIIQLGLVYWVAMQVMQK
ncbi:MAG: DUF1294 domain-containing protein [Methylococcales bacterium]|jgi:uncharacterized membrane protein YsdA (DUF1294 family)/cold shock CspA family protein|nr:DUF1294 domain-containing protein [Methylococcales bacterium]